MKCQRNNYSLVTCHAKEILTSNSKFASSLTEFQTVRALDINGHRMDTAAEENVSNTDIGPEPH